MGKMPPANQLKGRQLGRILIKMGILTRDKVNECLEVQQKRGGGVKLGQICLEKGLIKKKDLQAALAGQRGMDCVELDSLEIPKAVIDLVPAQMAKTYRVLPITFDDRKSLLTIAMDNPDNFRDGRPQHAGRILHRSEDRRFRRLGYGHQQVLRGGGFEPQ